MSLILQQSLSLGVIGFAMAVVIGRLTFDMWPRRVSVQPVDQFLLLGIVVLICVLASLVGIRKALKVEAGVALTG